MCLRADEDGDRRRAVQSIGLDVPSGALEDGMTSRREADRVPEAGAGRKAEARVLRESEQLEHPSPGDFLGRRRGRGERVQRGVLAPRGGEPVGRRRCRQGSADHEAEVARTRRRDQAGIDRRCQLLHHRRCVHAAFGQRAAEPGGDRCSVGR